MIAALLALALGVQQGAPSMVVTPAQFTDALGICRGQLMSPDLAAERMVTAGWPKVASQASDGTAPAQTMYRHPENMLLLAVIDFPAAPDECTVMVPLRYELNPENIAAAVSAFTGTKAKRGASPSWQTDWADLRLETQGDISARIIITKKDR